MRANLILSMLVVALILPSVVRAQNARGLPEMAVPLPRQNLDLIMDVMDRQVMNRSVQVSVTDGIKTIRAVENDLKAVIHDDPEVGISMKITRQYSPDQIDELVESHPELAMYLQSIPKEIGETEIEITVGVTSKYEAADSEELKEKHPEAYEVYRKFSSAQPVDMEFRFPGPLQIRPIPQIQFDIDPNRVRIHEDKEKKPKGDKRDQKDKDT